MPSKTPQSHIKLQRQVSSLQRELAQRDGQIKELWEELLAARKGYYNHDEDHEAFLVGLSWRLQQGQDGAWILYNEGESHDIYDTEADAVRAGQEIYGSGFFSVYQVRRDIKRRSA